VDNLIARNNQLKTRVAELELVNDLFRSRVTELENSEANARRAEMSRQDVETQLRATLEAALKREGALKRRVEELENSGSGNSRERKKVKVSDLTQ
jgi:GATA-binding protein